MNAEHTEEAATMAKEAEAKAIVVQGGTVVQAWQPVDWNEERQKLAKAQVCPPGTSDAEFSFFLDYCKQTQLNPFLKQAYLVERRGQDAQGNWVSKREPMAAEQGLAARADALPDFRGMQSDAVYAGDVFKRVTEDGQQKIVHEWSLEAREKAGNRLIGAWAHGRRDGRVVPPTFLLLEDRIQKKKDGTATQFWQGSKAALQLKKCARAEQYRLLYPNLFGGVYISEEMPDEEYVEGEVTSVARASPPASRTAAVLAKVQAAAASAPTTPAPVVVQEAPAAAPTEPAPKAPVVEFGQKSGLPVGKAISTLEASELENCIATYTKHLADPRTKGAAYEKKMAANLDELKSELERRIAGAGEEAPF